MLAIKNSSNYTVDLHHFGPVSFSVVDEVLNLTIAIYLWYLPHCQFGRIGKPVQFWCVDKFEHPSYYSFVPIRLIKQRCSYSNNVFFTLALRQSFMYNYY